MSTITFPEEADFKSRGRGGLVRTTGVQGTDLATGNSIGLFPITAHGMAAEAASTVVHRDALDDLIEALQSLKTRQAARKPTRLPAQEDRWTEVCDKST